jgi:uncharacterized membrane protein YhhN
VPWSALLVAATAGAVVSLVRAIRVGDRALEVISKTAASACFVALGLTCWQTGDLVGGWLVAGLLLCAAGDLCLLDDRSFTAGLLAFLLGHLAYVGAFATALPASAWPLPILAVVVAAGVAAARWLWPHLGRRRMPVLAYIAAISLMTWGGLAAAAAGALPVRGATGAVLFYLSDLAVARQRFVRPAFINRALGLPLYYLGQLLLALTIGS